MTTQPAAAAFAQSYADGHPQVVWTTLVADLETPVSAFLKIAAGRPMSFLLESVEGGAVRGRYSIIGLDPDLIWRTVGGRAEINRAARERHGRFTPCTQGPLAALRFKRHGLYHDVSWDRYRRETLCAAAALVDVGIQVGCIR